jgi:hypothetical protein
LVRSSTIDIPADLKYSEVEALIEFHREFLIAENIQNLEVSRELDPPTTDFSIDVIRLEHADFKIIEFKFRNHASSYPRHRSINGSDVLEFNIDIPLSVRCSRFEKLESVELHSGYIFICRTLKCSKSLESWIFNHGCATRFEISNASG